MKMAWRKAKQAKMVKRNKMAIMMKKDDVMKNNIEICGVMNGNKRGGVMNVSM